MFVGFQHSENGYLVDVNNGTYKLYDISTISQHVLNPPTDLVGAASNGHSENEMGELIP